MTGHAFSRQAKMLDALEARGRYRRLIPARGHDFSSNDYLGLANGDALRQAAAEAIARGVPVGSGGSRLLRGNAAEHEALEAEAAAFFGSQTALFMGGGFTANQAIFSTLPQSDDLVLHDALIHASAHEGMRLGRAPTQEFAHNDATEARRACKAWRDEGGTGTIWIAVEAVYSMDGDTAPLADLMQVADEFDGILVIDEAHSSGVFGKNGQGLGHPFAHRENVISLHTCGKALGASGALICGPQTVKYLLINKARNFIFSTAPSPLVAAIVRAALQLLHRNPSLRSVAWDRIDHAQAQARHHGLPVSNSQIIPVQIGDDKETMALASALQDRGFDIRGIRPPTVPRGTSRLRLSINPTLSPETITDAFTAIAELRGRSS